MFNLKVLEWNDEGNGMTLNKEGKRKNTRRDLANTDGHIYLVENTTELFLTVVGPHGNY